MDGNIAFKGDSTMLQRNSRWEKVWHNGATAPSRVIGFKNKCSAKSLKYKDLHRMWCLTPTFLGCLQHEAVKEAYRLGVGHLHLCGGYNEVPLH